MEKKNGEVCRNAETRPIKSPAEECHKQGNVPLQKEPSFHRNAVKREQVVGQNAPPQALHQISSKPICSPSSRQDAITPGVAVGISNYPSSRGRRLSASDQNLCRRDCATAASSRLEGRDHAVRQEKAMLTNSASSRKKHGRHARKKVSPRSSSTTSKVPRRGPKSTSSRHKPDTADASTNTVISSELVLLSLISTVRSDRACNKSTQTADAVVMPKTRATAPSTASSGTSPRVAASHRSLSVPPKSRPRAVKSDTSVVTAHIAALKTDEDRGPSGYIFNDSYERSFLTEGENEYHSTFLSSDAGAEEDTPDYLDESADPGSSSLFSTVPLNPSASAKTLELALNIQPKYAKVSKESQHYVNAENRREEQKNCRDRAGRRDEIFEVTEEFFEANSNPESDDEATMMVVREETVLEEYSLSEDISGSGYENNVMQQSYEERLEESRQNTRYRPLDASERTGPKYSKGLRSRSECASSSRPKEDLPSPQFSTYGEGPSGPTPARQGEQFQVKQTTQSLPVRKQGSSNRTDISSSRNCQVPPENMGGFSCFTAQPRGFLNKDKILYSPKQYVDAASSPSGVQYTALCANCQARRNHLCNCSMAFVRRLPHQDHRHTDNSMTRRVPCARSHVQSVPVPSQCQRCLEIAASKTGRKTRKVQSKSDRDERTRRSNESLRSSASRRSAAPGSKSVPQKRANSSQKSYKRSCEATCSRPVKASSSAASRTLNTSSRKATSRGTAAQSWAARGMARSDNENAASLVVPSAQRHATRQDEGAQDRDVSKSRQGVPMGEQAHATDSTSRGQESTRQVASSANDRNQGATPTERGPRQGVRQPGGPDEADQGQRPSQPHREM